MLASLHYKYDDLYSLHTFYTWEHSSMLPPRGGWYNYNIKKTMLTDLWLLQLNRKINDISICVWNIRHYYENLDNYYSHYDYSFFNMLSQQQHINMQIRYTVFNGKTSLWKFLHTYCIKQNGISNHFVIYFIT